MPVEVEEKYGRKRRSGDTEKIYQVTGTEDPAAAETAVVDHIEAGLPSGDPGPDEVDVDEIDGLPGGGYIARATWLSPERAATTMQPPIQPGDPPRISFSTRGGRERVTQSLQTINSYAPSGQTAPDFGGAINVTDQGVEGVELTVPVWQFNETHGFADSLVDTAYRSALFGLTGRVNDDTFRELSAGECLFLGAAGRQRGDGPWEIDFAFAGSPNLTGLSAGDITGIAKLGWEYLWFRYQEFEESGFIVRKPLAAYVEQVYKIGDFSGLNLGS